MIESLILASVGLASIGSITLVILLLMSGKGWLNGLGYVLGYTTSYALIGIAVIVFGFTTTSTTSKNLGIFSPLLFIILGTTFLLFAQHNWRKPKTKIENRFFSYLDKTTPFKSFAFGALVSVINFKNLVFFLSAIWVIHLNNSDLSFKIINVLLVTFVFCFSVIAPVFISIVFPTASKKFLQKMKHFLDTQSHVIGFWIPFIFGILFFVNGVIKLL